MANHHKVFAPAKVAGERDKINAYLKGERIFPTTMELDLTQLCTRACPGCPYTAGRSNRQTLELPFVSRLFDTLGGNTPGLVLSGGESTIVPHFPQTVQLAREKGIKEIAVISNGGYTDKPVVQDALLEHVTSIRFSLYDWQDLESTYFLNTLKKIEALRHRIESEGSRLEIGASMLTICEWNDRYEPVAHRALNSGIHWLYFHPYCVDWETGYPRQANQSGVLDAVTSLINNSPGDANIQVPAERYSLEPLHFEKLHGAHFLIEVGADGILYAGPECKYENQAVLLDLNEYLEDDFLWHPRRLERIEQMDSNHYNSIGTRHRPPMFSDYLQKLILQQKDGSEELPEESRAFSYTNIL